MEKVRTQRGWAYCFNVVDGQHENGLTVLGDTFMKGTAWILHFFFLAKIIGIGSPSIVQLFT
jgi:hypothetical protein